MSFHGRLRLFFTIIVIVPMVAVAVVMLVVTQQSETGKTDAGIAKGTDVALSVYSDSVRHARGVLRRTAAQSSLTTALAAGRTGEARARMRAIVRSGGAVRIEYRRPDGALGAAAGSGSGAMAFARAPLVRSGGARVGSLLVSVTRSTAYTRRVSRLTGLEVVLQRGERRVAGTLPHTGTLNAGSDTVSVGGRDFRSRTTNVKEPTGTYTQIGVLADSSDVNSTIGHTRLLVIGILLAFLVFALVFSLTIVRGLQSQIGQFLEAARRLGRGQFDRRVPVVGNDEFADLGREFNRMSDQLEANIQEIDEKRQELEETIRRVGQAFAAGLDPQGVVELAVQTAVDACDASAGRALPGEAFPLRPLRVGLTETRFASALEAAEEAARTEDGEPRPGAAHATEDGIHALAVPLLARLGTGPATSDVGVVSIARQGREFERSDAQLLEYLAGQAVVSIENADLHATVQRQAVTDELTGLANVRELQSGLEQEIERGRRFDTSVGFVMLDIDDFKAVNDTFGHPQGDDVLVAVAAVMRDLSRDVDQPARYGGEELAVVLPGTDVAGAELLAGRMRAAIEDLRVPSRSGGDDLRVTASFGVAAIPESAHDATSVIAAADQALYRAKRGGKNRVARADAVPVSR